MEWERRPPLTCKLRIQSNSFFINDTSFPDVLHRTIRLTTKQLFSLRLFRVAYVSSWASYAPSIRHLYIHGLTPSNELLSHMEQKEKKNVHDSIEPAAHDLIQYRSQISCWRWCWNTQDEKPTVPPVETHRQVTTLTSNDTMNKYISLKKVFLDMCMLLLVWPVILFPLINHQNVEGYLEVVNRWRSWYLNNRWLRLNQAYFRNRFSHTMHKHAWPTPTAQRI